MGMTDMCGFNSNVPTYPSVWVLVPGCMFALEGGSLISEEKLSNGILALNFSII